MILRRLTLTMALTAALAAAGPSAAHAQRCGVGRAWVGAAGGYAHYDVAGGTNATEVGADLGLHLGGVAFQAGYRRILPESGIADPDGVRLSLGIPVMDVVGLGVCLVGHGGGTRYAAEGETGTTAVGGFGLRLERSLASGRVLPFVEVRALGASLTGEALGIDVDATGYSVGGEGGVEAALGGLRVAGAVSVDGFDPGLGVTPYPALGIRLGLGLRF